MLEFKLWMLNFVLISPLQLFNAESLLKFHFIDLPIQNLDPQVLNPNLRKSEDSSPIKDHFLMPKTFEFLKFETL